MKKYLVVISLLTTIGLGSCAKDEPVKPLPVVKTYPVNPTIAAMNVEIGGRPFNIETRRDGWGASATRGWVAKEGVPYYIKHSFNFFRGERENGKHTDATFYISAPPMYIIDPEDLTFKFDKTYNYPAIVNHFKKGNYPIQVGNDLNGYFMFLSFVDKNNPENGFGYSTNLGSQEGSKWEIVKVEEVYGQGIYVTYHIDCNIFHFNEKKEVVKDKFVGTVQTLYRYRPLD
jgi:hypothetical protein